MDMNSATVPLDSESVSSRLLAWYNRHARRLPWRALPGQTADPYAVWLSEVMLQQTTVAAVKPYYERFLARWPSVDNLAAAPLDEVLAAWAGLGYYARARNLHRCAQVVSQEHGGQFPDNVDALRELPGIGAYTAAAIAAIAFGRQATPVDGNIERVTARLFAHEAPLPPAKKELARLAEVITPEKRCGDFAQAMMDLGATICMPRGPKCLLCPLADLCKARRFDIAEALPVKTPKKARPTRYGIAFWLTAPDGSVLLRQRPSKGLLGGMTEVPSTEWREDVWSEAEALPQAPLAASWEELPGQVRHTFTHFHLELTVWQACLSSTDSAQQAVGIWHRFDDLDGLALPSVMRKVIAHSIRHAG